MKKLFYYFLMVLSFNSFGEEFEDDWYVNWPSSLSFDTIFYRGQRTDLATFDHLIDMLINPSSDKVISSRMYRTFEKLFPNFSTEELNELANLQYNFWKQERMLGWVSNCHADPHLCHLPKIEKLMGPVLKPEHLPIAILQKLKKDQDENFVITENITKGELLEFFDPIVSTSYRLDIAEGFAKDKDGNDGYILILNDKFNRNCSEKDKETANCFINNEEFMEELEFPMWGYVTSDEVDGIIVENITLRKFDKNKLLIIDSIKDSQVEIELNTQQACIAIAKISGEKLKIARLTKALSSYFNCLK